MRKLGVYLIVFLFSGVVHAMQPSPAQIAQFKSLSPSQQQMLAKQMGVDISTLQGKGAEAVVEVAPSIQRSTVISSSNQTKQVAKQSGSHLKHFGYDVFSGQPLSHAAIQDMPVPLNYEIGAGDVIRIQLFGNTYQDLKLKVDREGKVVLPEYGSEYVAGQTLGELKDSITSFVKRKAIGVEALVSLSSMRAMQIFLVGEVVQPGAYNVNALTTISQVLTAAGGINETGSLRNIQLKREGRIVAHFDAYDMLIHGDSSGDVRLMAGDTLFVPVKKASVKITGQVLKPAYYELIQGTTVDNLISMAGGAKPNAYLSAVNVTRYTNKGPKQYTLDLSHSANRSFALHNGDEISLQQAGATLSGAFALRGAVARQGAYQLKGNPWLSDVVSKETLLETADLSYSLVVREKGLNKQIEVIQIDLGKLLTQPRSKYDIKLLESDQIFVFDNGLNLDYWYRKKTNSTAKAKNTGDRVVERLDQETGALVTVDQSAKVAGGNIEEVAQADFVRHASRDNLLKPIVERLKAQATLNNAAPLISVSGAVKYPGVYPLAINADFNRVIEAAGGYSEQAYLFEAELTREYKQGDKFTIDQLVFSPREVGAGQQPLILQAQDSIMIKMQPEWQRDLTVELQGEVVFPGTYTFKRGDTIVDLLERAGGMTRFAYPNGAVFSRESLKRQEQERLKLLNLQLKQEIGNLALRRQNTSATYTTTPQDAMVVADELAKMEAMGRLVIDLPKAINGDPTANIMLENGDKLYIPNMQPVVSIMGEVQFASNHTYTPDFSIDDYLEVAGGTKKQADTGRIYVVRADGSVMMPNNSFWFSRSSGELEPGDTIIVPIDVDYLDGLSTLTSATQILYQIGVAWSAVKN
ncbi:SLBB domain-containing protein [Vibrio sinensis]|nr:SLBB domain-containing protein [Vibrio sinensis]